jgi:hypothetical protein
MRQERANKTSSRTQQLLSTLAVLTPARRASAPISPHSTTTLAAATDRDRRGANTSTTQTLWRALHTKTRLSAAFGMSPRGGGRPHRHLILGLACSAAMLGVLPSIASATNAPWWHLMSGARPTYLHAGARKPAVTGEPEIQQINTPLLAENQTGFKLTVGTGTDKKILGEGFATEPTAAEDGFENLTAANLQTALEGPYGAGKVHVTQCETGSPICEPPAGELAFQVSSDPTTLPVGVIDLGFGITPTATIIDPGVAETPATPDGELYATAENLGDATTTGKVQFKDILPGNLKAISVSGAKPFNEGDFSQRSPIPCSLEEKGGVQTATCTLEGPLAPYDQIEMRIGVNVEPGATTGELNEPSISGGGAAPLAITRPIIISNEPVPFGLETNEFALEEEGGAPVTQAGSHPFQLTSTIALNQLADTNPVLGAVKPEVTVPELPKDLNVKLPPGLIGNATTIPQCSTAQFYRVNFNEDQEDNECPADTAVGVATTTVHEPATVGTVTITEPIFNLEPREGEPARFGFYVIIANSPVSIDTSVRTGGDYGVTVNVQNITQTAAFLSSETTFWGVPGDPRHDNQRGWGCLYEARNFNPHLPCTPASEGHPKAFLSLPTSCTDALTTSIQIDPWTAPGSFLDSPSVFEPAGALKGCNHLRFAPEFTLNPEKSEASTPTGVTADVNMPQEEALNGNGLVPSALKATTVTLPEGFQLNASAAGGLEACTEAQASIHDTKDATCPDAAKLANVTVTTPVLPNPLKGSIYLASPQNFPAGPQENPFKTLLAAYLVVKDPTSGVLVKLAGEGKLNQTTGQITLGFESPEVPFEHAKFEFLGGQRAPVATPAHCGTYTTLASFTPWSGTPPVNTETSFNITSGPGGGPCPPASLPFAPSLIAGTTSNIAGAFSPLTTTLSRQDGEQFMNQVTLHMPPGLAGVIAGIPRCAEAQANAGTCSQASLIGHTTASVGIGKDPFTVTGGQVYLTEGYKGAPFGLSIVTPAKAGPFDLGNVTVRAKIEVDPNTAALTVTSDELPHILKGVPLEIKKVNVTIDRPNFTFNPTNCTPQTVTGTIGAVEGATAPVSSRFQAGGCGELPFKPTLTAAVTGHNSKLNGAALTVKVTAKHGEANIHKVELQIPISLPSRLTTLQKSCTEAQFNLNPAGCPAASFIGTATARTPILAVPLTGPAIIVSHGNAGFPDVEFLLQGEGVKVTLDGKTDIKKGITYSRFQTVPDEPVTSFETKLPQGPHSILGAFVKGKSHYNLCGHKLAIPTVISGQNGAVIRKSTAVRITGCPKPHKARKKHARKSRAATRSRA